MGGGRGAASAAGSTRPTSCTGEVCVITNIDLEHTNVLGPTRRDIAREKAGILEQGCTLVTGVRAGEAPPEDDPATVIERAAAALDVRILRPELPEPGASALERNTALARLVLDELGRRGVRGPDGEAVSASLLDPSTIESARLPGRAERGGSDAPEWSSTPRTSPPASRCCSPSCLASGNSLPPGGHPRARPRQGCRARSSRHWRAMSIGWCAPQWPPGRCGMLRLWRRPLELRESWPKQPRTRDGPSPGLST